MAHTVPLKVTVEARLVVSDATRAALIALGWTPPAEPAPQTDREPSRDPIEITPYLVVHRYRTDRGGWEWGWRCDGDGTCDGHVALDLNSRAHAERNAREHLATEHATDTAAKGD